MARPMKNKHQNNTVHGISDSGDRVEVVLAAVSPLGSALFMILGRRLAVFT